MNKSELLNLLNETRLTTIENFNLPETELGKTYGEGKWNIRQILHHLTDTEMLFNGRLKKIIAEPKQVIWAFNPDDWNAAFNYISETLNGKMELYTLFRKMNYQLIDQFYDEFEQKEFVHNQTGLRTLKMEFEKVAMHNQSHLDQIKIALSK